MVYLKSPLELELELTDQQFFELCHKHEDFKFERTATGALIIMSPTGGITSIRNSEINFQLRAWNRDRQLWSAVGMVDRPATASGGGL